ncbi:polysaccharide biosynthesis protein [Methylobacillus arboreus]|uniref:polysaccharide biosynthesis protein n=1 Tax=Methylobacillus arboreus TaxID=755170 RepID=UPI001E340E08|nr:nucleoside-diphosphate sugar epimerase/dehydratase [Methylobacillus arboreus]MCB5189964.1 polysaccharide biosynthesis protein [Methylobacillus arboreus]
MLNYFPKFNWSNYISLRNPRSISAWVHDIVVAVLAWWVAFLLRFNFDIPASFTQSMLESAVWVIPLQAVVFLLAGLYRGVWRFASLPDLQRLLRAIGISAVLVVTVLFMVPYHGVVPRSVLIMDPMLLLLLMGGSRFAYRAWKEHRLYGAAQFSGKPVLVLGAGEAAIALLKDLSKSHEWHVVGLLDDKKTMQGRELLGVNVLGAIEQLPQIAAALSVSHVIVAMPAARHQRRRQIVELASSRGLKVLTVPSFDDLMSGRLSVAQLRPVEVEDLLGREPVSLDDNGLQHLIEGQAVLVSGAGGSIGSELCRQVLKYHPLCLVCLDQSEFSLYRLEQEISRLDIATPVEYIVGDVRNRRRMQQLLGRYAPSVVFHAAAYKHVPMMENRNVAESLSNNVNGTYTLAQACKTAGVAKFVLISTDKAVNPTNVMGASKRLAEMVCQGLQEESGTRFVVVRFGNVLGSSGSVIPKFREQIAQGGPITVTHPDITRYFMSIPEACQLVMQAGMMGSGGEIFVLDMGDPVKIVDLARDMIRLSGLNEADIEIVYSGLRPGEKLYEELLADDELTLPTPHDKLRIAVARSADEAWVSALLKWIDRALFIDEAVVKQELKMWVEEYAGDIHANPSTTFPPESSTIH